MKDLQWDQSSPGNSASHYSDQSIITLDFLAAWVVLNFPKEVHKMFFLFKSQFCVTKIH